MTKTATPLTDAAEETVVTSNGKRRVGFVNSKFSRTLESDRARLIEFVAKIEDELKVLGKLRAVDLLFRKARALLLELEAK